MKRILSVILSIIFTSSAFAAGDLQQALDIARVKNRVGAMQMTIIKRGQTPMTFSSGKNMQGSDAKDITDKTLFQIGSETKSYTAALLLKLELEGKLKLTDSLGQYLPQYKRWSHVTLSQLLHNNSGIPSYSEDKGFQKEIAKNPSRQWEPAELIEIARKRPNDFAAGHGWHYSNSNFILAGMIAEKVSLQSLNNLYQQYFLSPNALNLTHTYYLPTTYSPDMIKRMAHGYDDQNRDITYDNMSWGGAAGAMVANSSDLAKWAYDLFHGKALSENALKQLMHTVSTKTGVVDPAGKEGYGLGVGTRVDKEFGTWWGHEGETLGYHAIFIWYPTYDLTVAVVSNGEAPELKTFAVSLPKVLGLKHTS